jgi:hypothetical protein
MADDNPNGFDPAMAAAVAASAAINDFGLAIGRAALAQGLFSVAAAESELAGLRRTWRRALGRKLVKGSCGLPVCIAAEKPIAAATPGAT